jgi:hypothetical protein
MDRVMGAWKLDRDPVQPASGVEANMVVDWSVGVPRIDGGELDLLLQQAFDPALARP